MANHALSVVVPIYNEEEALALFLLDIVAEVYDYVLITHSEWQEIENDPQQYETVTGLYDRFFSASNRLVLLKPYP